MEPNILSPERCQRALEQIASVLRWTAAIVTAGFIVWRAVDLPPPAALLAQTALGALFGLAGIVLATPVAAAILATLRGVTSDADDDTNPVRPQAE